MCSSPSPAVGCVTRSPPAARQSRDGLVAVRSLLVLPASASDMLSFGQLLCGARRRAGAAPRQCGYTSANAAALVAPVDVRRKLAAVWAGVGGGLWPRLAST